jgi:hypothetical protein
MLIAISEITCINTVRSFVNYMDEDISVMTGDRPAKLARTNNAVELTKNEILVPSVYAKYWQEYL